jgi:hypothetical protein
MKRLMMAAAMVLMFAGVGRAAEMPGVAELTVLPGVEMQVPPPPADVDNPSAVQFTASSDHAAIDSYELDILRADGTVLQTLNLGKPTPDATNTVTAPINVQPVAFATGYSVRVRAKAGTSASDYAVSLNKFNRKPGAPSKAVVK